MLNILLGCANLEVNTKRVKLVDYNNDTLITGTLREVDSMVTLLDFKPLYIDNESLETKDNFYLNAPVICRYKHINIITDSSHAERCHKIVRLLGYKGTVSFTLNYDGLKEEIESTYWDRF